MKFNMKLLGAALLLGAGLAGCSPGIDADLSPDGTTVVQASDKGLSLGPSDGTGAGRIVVPGAVGSPRFSPDGSKVVAWATTNPPRALLVDAKTGNSKALGATLWPPYAWKPDGTEVLGWSDEKTAAVYHLASREVVRTYPVARPQFACWLPGGRDFAVAYGDSVSVLRQGQIVRQKAELERIETLGLVANRLVWIETQENQGDPTVPSQLRVRAMDLDSGAVSTIRDIDDASVKLGGKVFLMPYTVSIAPRSSRMAVGGLVLTSPEGVWQRAVAVDKRLRDHPNDAKARREMKMLEKQLKFEAVTAIIGLDKDESFVLARTGNLKDFSDAPHDLRWSADGTKLAMVYRSDTKVVSVPQ
jgi:hypothetical protein